MDFIKKGHNLSVKHSGGSPKLWGCFVAGVSGSLGKIIGFKYQNMTA